MTKHVGCTVFNSDHTLTHITTKSHYTHVLHFEQICRKMFLFLHNIGCRRYKSVKDAYIQNGLEPIVHGNKNRSPSHAFTTADLLNITAFLTNYGEEHDILLPGRIPGFKRCDLVLLPTNSTKKAIWECYVRCSATLTFRLASYRTFCRVWQKYRPKLVITTPKSDLCWTCQRNSMEISATANRTEVDKLKSIDIV